MTDSQSRHRISRRHFVGGAAAGAAGLTLARFEAQARSAGLARNSARFLRQEGKPGGRLVYGLGFDVDGTLDPQVTHFDSTIRVTLNICEPLVWMPTATEIVPGLAESWEISEDGTEYTFHLKPNVTFHDGTPFNAEAVKFTFDRVVGLDRQDAGTPSPDPVITSGQAHDQIGPYDHAEVIDDLTVKIVLQTPFAPFLTGINGYLGIVSPTAVRTMGLEEFARHPIGTGPYMFSEWVEADHVTLTRNPDYNWGSSYFANPGAPFFDEIEFKIIADASVRTGTVTSDETQYIDSIDPLQYEDLKSNGDVTVIEQAQPGSGYILLLNLSRDTPIADKAVRQAMHFALDKEAFNTAVFGGLNRPAASPLMQVTLGYDPQTESLYSFDTSKAEQILDEAGWVRNGDIREKDGQPLALYWPVQEREPDKAMATFCQGAWRQIGIDCQLEVMERGLLSQTIREDNNYDVGFMWFSYADPDVLRTIFWSKNFDGFNRAKLADPEVDAWLEEGYQTTDAAARSELYSKVQMKVLQDAVTIPLVDTLTYNAKASRVQGEVLDFLASYVWLNSAYFE
jgi:peptide/nickel transport system substrate-binding protein